MARLQRLWRFALARNAVRSTRGAAAEAEVLAIAAGLPEDTRRVVTLHKVYGLATPEIAARLGLDAQLVEQHLVCAALAFSGSCGPQFTGAARTSRASLDPSESA